MRHSSIIVCLLICGCVSSPRPKPQSGAASEPAGLKSCPAFTYTSVEAQRARGGRASLSCNVDDIGKADACRVIAGVAGLDDARLVSYAESCAYFPQVFQGKVVDSAAVPVALELPPPEPAHSGAAAIPVAVPEQEGRLRTCNPFRFSPDEVLMDAHGVADLECRVAQGRATVCTVFGHVDALSDARLLSWVSSCTIDPADGDNVHLSINIPHAAATPEQISASRRFRQALALSRRPGFVAPRVHQDSIPTMRESSGGPRDQRFKTLSLCTIGVDGRTHDCALVVGTNVSNLNDDLLDALGELRFTPATLDGEPIELPGLLIPWVIKT